MIEIDDPRLPERFWSKVSPEPNTGCWLWTACTDRDGYGIYWVKAIDQNGKAHRCSYEGLVAPIPAGLLMDHLCRVRCCVNPLHLEPVTPAENVRRGESGINMRSKTTCPRGHAYHHARDSEGKRFCYICNNANKRAWKARRKAEKC